MIRTDMPAIIVEAIDIEAPMEDVFAALTEPEQLVQWWGSDESYHCRAMESDLRPGGAWKTSGEDPAGKPFTVGGVYRIVEPPHCLEFTWRHGWGDGDTAIGDTVVRYDLDERGGVTHLRVTHTGFTSQADRDGHEKGWRIVLNWLRDYITRR